MAISPLPTPGSHQPLKGMGDIEVMYCLKDEYAWKYMKGAQQNLLCGTTGRWGLCSSNELTRLLILESWVRVNRMKLNPDRCQMLYLEKNSQKTSTNPTTMRWATTGWMAAQWRSI